MADPCVGCGLEARPDCPVCGGVAPGSFEGALIDLGASLREFEQRLSESTSPALVRAAKTVARWAASIEQRRGR